MLQVVCAGSQDTFDVVVWSVKTGRLLDVLAGHEGPVSGLAFSPNGPLLASVSWDHTLRTWDVFAGKGALSDFSFQISCDNPAPRFTAPLPIYLS